MLFLGGKESSTLKEISETLGKETIDLYNTSDTRGQSPSFGTTYQKTGKELMSRDELSVMDLPYKKGVYFPDTTSTEKISVDAERQRRYRATKKLRAAPTEEHLWEVILMYQKVRFKTYSGLPFSYEIRKGRSGEYTKELWIDRRENSKSLAWSSVQMALGNVKEVGAVVDRPKALGDIRGVTYIYGMFYRFGLIDVPNEAKQKMNKSGCASKG